MAHTVYENFYLSNEVEDQFQSHLDLQQFCTVDTCLEGTPGMERVINVYRATAGTEKLAMGEGNTKSIAVGHTPAVYRIQLAQNRFEYYDEQAMTDPMLVPTGVKQMGTDLFNTANADIYAEFNKATKVVVTSAFGFDCFADAQSMFGAEDLEQLVMFAFVHPTDVAGLRKALKDSLQYVEAFARAGYVGTVAGVNVYTKANATPGSIVIATKQAVTMFVKTGTEVEQPQRDSADANVRKNTIFARKYYLAALTDGRQAVKVVKGSMAASADETVTEGKTYYAASGLGYVAVTPTDGDNPSDKGWFELN